MTRKHLICEFFSCQSAQKMGDWIHCNVCIRMPSQGNEQYPFYFTSCGHIICGKCYETG